EILMAVKSGKAIRFPESKIRPMGRTASGVKGVSMSESDEVIGMICVLPTDENGILVVSEKGYGKRSPLEDYRITNRGGKGVKTINITEKTGSLIALKAVDDNDDLMIINKSGLTIRMEVSSLRVMGRATQGVKLINLRNEDSIAAICAIEVSDEDRELRNMEPIDETEIQNIPDASDDETDSIEPNSEE